MNISDNDEDDLLQLALREEYAKYRARTGFPLSYDAWLKMEDARAEENFFIP